MGQPIAVIWEKDMTRNKMEATLKNLAFLCFLLMIPFLQGCVNSQHWDDTLHDPQKTWEVERQLKTPEERAYWDKIKENRDSTFIIIDDSIDQMNRRR